MARQALGKGLGSIFKDLGTPIVDSQTQKQLISEIELSRISPNPFQPRKTFDKSEINELSQSIHQQGLLQPIVVRMHEAEFQIIAGERRFRAFQDLNKETIPCFLRKSVSDRDMMELSIIENIQRVQLNVVEEAEAYVQLIQECGLTHEKLSEKLGKSRSAVTNILRLLKLAPEIQEMLKENKLTMGHARSLISLDFESQLVMAKKIIEEDLSVRDTEKTTIPKSIKPVSSKIPQDPNLKAIISELQYFLANPVKLLGNEKKGKIEVSYQSQEQLQQLVNVILYKAKESQ